MSQSISLAKDMLVHNLGHTVGKLIPKHFGISQCSYEGLKVKAPGTEK